MFLLFLDTFQRQMTSVQNCPVTNMERQFTSIQNRHVTHAGPEQPFRCLDGSKTDNSHLIYMRANGHLVFL